MEGKKKQRGGILLAKPDYKKAYVTLKTPLSISPDLYPIKVIDDDKKDLNKQSKTSIVEVDGGKRSHWLDGDRCPVMPSRARGRGRGGDETAKFPWTSMKKNAPGSTSR